MVNYINAGDKKVIWPPVPSPPEVSREKTGTAKNVKTPAGSFAGALEKARLQQEPDLKVSAHARQRLATRDISMDERDWQEISMAVDKARDKGSRSSLLLYGDVALVASVNNRTIVTAMDGMDAREHIFTNIDSAVIVK